jgi:hypothetical protein
MIRGLRPYGLEDGPGLPSGRLTDDDNQTLLAYGAAQFLIDVSRDVGRGHTHGSLLRMTGEDFGGMDTEHHRIGDVTDPRQPSPPALQGEAFGEFPS